MEAEIRRVVRAGRRPRATAGCAPGSTQLYHAEMRPLHRRATSTRRFELLGPDLARLAALGGFGRLAPRIARYLPDERLQPDLLLPGALRGRAAAAGARRVRASSPTWTRSRACTSPGAACDAVPPGAGRRGGRRRRGVPLRAHGDRAGAVGGRVTGSATGPRGRHGGAAGLRRGRRSPRICRSSTGCWGGRRAARVPLRWAPRRGRPARRGHDRARPELAHHTISFGAAWESTFREITDDGPADERPVVAGHPADGDRPGRSLPPGGTCSSCWPRARTRRPARSTGRAVGPALPRRAAAPCWRPAASGWTGSRPRSMCRGWSRRRTGRPRARGGHAVRARPHVRADRAVPAAQPRAGVDNVVLAGCGTTPGVGIPPVLISGRLAAQRVTGTGRGSRGRTAR